MAPKLVFLPGAIGAAEFWRPVGRLLPAEWEKVYLSWPGLGTQQANDHVTGFDDLVSLVEQQLDRPSVLVAHSMGGIVALRAALRQREMVSLLVLTATSGGVDVAGLGGADWRDDYRKSYPEAAAWITLDRPNHSDEIGALPQPTLLLWGDADPISPVAVGERLRTLLQRAELRVIAGGAHSFAADRAETVAPLVMSHVSEHCG